MIKRVMIKRLPSLDALANVATIVVAVAIAVLAVQRVRQDRLSASAERMTGPKIGTVMPTIPGVSYDAVDRSVVLNVASKCKFCTDSMPFYKRLIDESRRTRSQLVVVGREPEDVLRGYMQEHGVQADKIVSITGELVGSFGFSGTPTLAVVDKGGKLIGSWRGRLSNEREPEVVQALAGR